MSGPATSFAKYYRACKRRAGVASERCRLRLAGSPAPLDVKRAVRSLPEHPSILVLCLGNICRSPMAERYLRRRAEETGVDGLTVRSAGFLPREGRPSPELARSVARQFDVDLSEHRSTAVTESLVDESDAVFVMDASNYRRLRAEFGDLDGAYFLGAFSGGHDGFEIPDPHGSDREQFERVYGEIAAAADEFLATVRGADDES